MPQRKLKCILILSAKSSGSTALQSLLTKFPQVNHIGKTRHFEYETLFWTKAASILQLPQVDMFDSEVPIVKEKARYDIINLLKQNLDSYVPPENDYDLIFNGWKLLCQKFAPVFVEKSPHHLHQSSALEMIYQCIDRLPEIDFFIIGLVRNPMAVLYSSWDRMRTQPEKNQYEWFTAYTNLLKFKELIDDRLIIVKYEDIVRDAFCLKRAFDFIGVKEKQISAGYIHGKSVEKWKRDGFYGFHLSKKVCALA